MRVEGGVDICEIGSVHLTDDDLANLERITSGPRPFSILAMRCPFGFWVRVPSRHHDDVEEAVHGVIQAGFGEDFVHLYRKAIGWDQPWLVFDFERDADEEDADLPTFTTAPDTRMAKGAVCMPFTLPS